MKLPVVLAVLIGTLVLACSSVTPVPAEPTPNIDAIVEAKVAQDAGVECADFEVHCRSCPGAHLALQLGNLCVGFTSMCAGRIELGAINLDPQARTRSGL